MLRDGLGEVACDALDGVLERILGCHAVGNIPPEEGLHNPMNRPQQDPALSKDVTPVLRLQVSLEDHRGPNSHRPAKSDVGSSASDILQ